MDNFDKAMQALGVSFEHNSKAEIFDAFAAAFSASLNCSMPPKDGCEWKLQYIDAGGGIRCSKIDSETKVERGYLEMYLDGKHRTSNHNDEDIIKMRQILAVGFVEMDSQQTSI